MGSYRIPRLAPDEYLQDRHVDASEAAAILGMSGPRFRQISGTREAPDAMLGAPRLEKGVRGGRWPLRRVLAYGMHHGREMRVPLPPLLPRPDGARRYEPWGPPQQVAAEAGGERIEAWAQMLESTSHERDGALFVLTPLWPTKSWRLRAALPELFQAFAQRAMLPQETPRPTAIIIPVIEEDPAPFWRVSVLPPTPQEPVYFAPFGDVARCLGWPAMPVWPRGTNAASAVAAWAPGRPVPVSIPAAWQARWTAAQYALKLADQTADAALAGSYRYTWWSVLSTMHHDQTFAPTKLPEDAEWAVDLRLPELPEPGTQYALFIPAVDDLVGTLHAPSYVAEALLSYFGDWRYSGPHTIELKHLPSPWTERFNAFRTAGEPATPEQLRTARIERLQREAIANGDGTFPEVRIVDQHVLAWSSTHLTWLGWNGYTSETADDLKAAWPAEAVEVLLTRDSERQPVGWTSTADGQLSPLPSERALMGLIPLTNMALGLDPVSTPPGLDQLLNSTSSTNPQTLAWPDFLALLGSSSLRNSTGSRPSHPDDRRGR